MEDQDWQALFDSQQKTLNELGRKVDFIVETLTVLQSLLVLEATKPGCFENLAPDELMQTLRESRKSVQESMTLLEAARKRNPPRPKPPGTAN